MNSTMQITFLVQHSSEVPYMVTFEKEENELYAFCSCPNGEQGPHCKHQLNILDGSNKEIISKNHDDVAKIQLWLHGTPLQVALDDFRTAEADAVSQKQLSEAKHNLAQIMHGIYIKEA